MPASAFQEDDWLSTWVPGDLSFDPTHVVFGSPAVPPIPFDFFDPGSDAFSGQVKLRGNLIGQGNTSVIIRRPGPPFLPADPPGGPVTVPIELVSMSLTSVSPIVVTYNGGFNPEIWDVRLQNSPTAPSHGQLTARKTHANGGLFDSFLVVRPLFVYTRHSDGAVRQFTAPDTPPVQLSSQGDPWVHQHWAGLNIIVSPSSAGSFVPGVVETNPPDITSQQAQTFDEVTNDPLPYSVKHTVCPPVDEPVCKYKITCADGACDLCPFCTDDICQFQRCPGTPTCALLNPTTCGPDCCLEYTFIGCLPPAGEPPCLIENACFCDPTPGACCHADGTCTVGPECACTGQYMGDGTVCGPLELCCFADGSCADLDEQCCTLAGGTPHHAQTCGPLELCCFADGSCADLDRWCCLDQGGTPHSGQFCGPLEKCCLSDGTCLMLDELCCIDIGGTPHPGQVCGQLELCCFADASCANLDPQCCIDLGGTPHAGQLCGPLETCCYPGGNCTNLDRQCCLDDGGTPHPGEVCGPLELCCYGDGSCADLDRQCCLDDGGTPYAGQFCGPLLGCCLGNTCQDLDPQCCQQLGGLVTTDLCDPPEQCCFNNGTCQDLDRECCFALGGTNYPGELCGPILGCCLPNGSCINTDPDCCQQANGTVTTDLCDAPQECCLPDGSCRNLDPECCIIAGGTVHLGQVCGPILGCCLPNGSCIDTDPDCCADESGTVTTDLCDPPEQCCFPDGSCVNMDRECCLLAGGTNYPGQLCGPVVVGCCLPDGSCIDTDPDCCTQVGGQVKAGGALCNPPQECCLSDGSCIDTDPECCQLAGGTVHAGLCGPIVGCCLPNGECIDTDPDCCQDMNGTIKPGGALCVPDQACCLPGGACIDTDPDCCLGMGGTPQGTGTNCLTNPCGNAMCEPNLQGTACVQACPNPLEQCTPTKLSCVPAPCRIVECMCLPQDACHINLPTTPTSQPFCSGVCPPFRQCVRRRIDTDGNGSLDGWNCRCVKKHPTPTGDPTLITKNRYLSASFSTPQEGDADAAQVGVSQAIRIKLVTLPAPFSAFNGTFAWAGPAQQVTEASGSSGPTPAPFFMASNLQCTENFADYGSVGLLHMSGAAIVPNGMYAVQIVDIECADSLDEEDCYSDPLNFTVPKFGDIAGVFDNGCSCWTGPNGIVEFQDVGALVDKFKNLPTAPIKVRSDLAGNVPNRVIDFRDIGRAVDAFKGLPYQTTEFSGPPTCP